MPSGILVQMGPVGPHDPGRVSCTAGEYFFQKSLLSTGDGPVVVAGEGQRQRKKAIGGRERPVHAFMVGKGTRIQRIAEFKGAVSLVSWRNFTVPSGTENGEGPGKIAKPPFQRTEWGDEQGLPLKKKPTT